MCWQSLATALGCACWLAAQACGAEALNCALPEPRLQGVQNATAVALPVAFTLTTSSAGPEAAYPAAVATLNGRDMPLNEEVVVKTPGRHRILVATISLDSACSRSDFFVFDTFSPVDDSSSQAEDPGDSKSPATECQQPELHLVIFWPAMGAHSTQKLFRLLSAFSDVASYPEAAQHLQLRNAFLVDPVHHFDEDWFRDFYGDGYYGLYFDSPEKVDMVHVKGDSAFHVALVEDLCPTYAFALERRTILNTNMLAIKNLLRQHSPHWFHVHGTQSRKEADADYQHLFGGTGASVFQRLQLDKRLQFDGYTGLHLVDQAGYSVPWKRVLVSVDAMEMLGAIMQSEWYRFELDVLELHAELTPQMLDPDPTSSLENIHRAAFLGSNRLPLLAHLPTDTRWYKGLLELKHVKAFRVLKENGWKLQLPPCSTVAAAGEVLSSPEASSLSKEASQDEWESLRDHVRQLQHRTDHFNHTVVAVGTNLDGPFTIWDGNHRAIALSLTQPSNHTLLVYIGISARFAAPHVGSFYCP